MSLKLQMRTSAKDILAVLENITDLTKEEQQKIICDKIKEKVVKNPSMDLLKEEILEDGSVVLTINV